MLTPLIQRYRKRRGRENRKAKPPTPPPAALTLVAAELVFDSPMIARLSFDRAIDVSGMDPSQITIQDPAGTGREYVGDSAGNQPTPESVDVELAEIGPAQGTLDVLSASADTGIVALNDGSAWPGVSELGLPYP